EHALDVRVLALLGVELEPAGDLRVLGGELGAGLAEEGQLGVVVGQQVVVHEPSPRTWKDRLLRSSTESKVTGSGSGSTLSIASIRNFTARSSSRPGSSVTTTPARRGSNRVIATWSAFLRRT